MISAATRPELARPTIPVRYLVDVLHRCRPAKKVLGRALDAAALSQRVLGSRRMRLSILQFESIHRTLARELDDELLGWLARPVPVGAYATLARLLTGCADVGSAFEAARRFYRLFDRHSYWQLDARGHLTWVKLVPRDREQERSIFFTHTMLLSPLRTLSWLAATPFQAEAIELSPRFRRYLAETRYLFGSEPTFVRGHPSIAVRSEGLRLPIGRTAVEADRWVKHSYEELLLAPASVTIEAQLRALLSSSDPIASASMSKAARGLHMSRSTLARKLKERGLSFQRVKDELRRDQAIDLLSGTWMTIADIGERLGYSAPSAFQRAFRDWTGVSPGNLRARLAPRASSSFTARHIRVRQQRNPAS